MSGTYLSLVRQSQSDQSTSVCRSLLEPRSSGYCHNSGYCSITRQSGDAQGMFLPETGLDWSQVFQFQCQWMPGMHLVWKCWHVKNPQSRNFFVLDLVGNNMQHSQCPYLICRRQIRPLTLCKDSLTALVLDQLIIYFAGSAYLRKRAELSFSIQSYSPIIWFSRFGSKGFSYFCFQFSISFRFISKVWNITRFDIRNQG